ncbi:DinB family protein [bacterium]|nr:MAG: DinB family protein [bacterium]
MEPFDHLLESLRRSRAFFWKHADRFEGDAWDYRLAPSLKSARETLQHLLVDDRAALFALRTGEEPDYDALGPAEADPAALKEMLQSSHAELLTELLLCRDRATLNVWGTEKPLLEGIAWFSSEDFYHAGQLAAMLVALRPDWDYYADIYGE